MTRVQKRILILLFTLLVAWRVFLVPSVSGAILGFITAGVVPGTDIIISPEVTYKLLLVLFAFTIFLVFRKEFFASMPQWLRRRDGVDVVTDTSFEAMDALLLQPASHVESKWSRSKSPKIPVVIKLPVKAKRPGLWFRLNGTYRLRYARYLLGIAALRAHKMSLKAGRQIIALLGKYGQRTYQVLRRFGSWIIKISRNGWKVAKPYLQELDQMIEHQLKSHKRSATILEKVEFTAKSVVMAIEHTSFRAKRR